MRARLSLGGAVALLLVAAVPAIAGPDNPNEVKGEKKADCIVTGLGKQGTFTFAGTLEAWPPNHKYETVNVTLTDEDTPVDETATDGVTVSMVGTHDQLDQVGSGNTDDDVIGGDLATGTGSATTQAQFRSERSGIPAEGEDPWAGRTYTFTVAGTVDGITPASGMACEPVTFTATVAHDQGNHGEKP